MLGRPGGGEARRLSDVLRKLGVSATLEDCDGTDKLLDCAAEQSVIPVATLERILEFTTVHPDERPESPFARHAPLPSSVAFTAPLSGWTEEHYTIGSRGLAGVLTRPVTAPAGGVVIMANNGVARSIGPARAWVEWARHWAELGIATLRLDLGGLGDSVCGDQQTGAHQYPITAIEDFAAAIADLRSRGLGPAVILGLCSGAFLGVDAAAARVDLAGVVAINSQLFYLPDPPGSPNRARRAAPPTQAWMQRFLENTRVGRRLGRDLPWPAWWLLDRLGIQPAPLRGADAANRATPVLLIYGDDNLGLLRLKQRDLRGLRRWQQAGRLIVMQGLDHSMFAPQIRRQVETRALAFVCERLNVRPSPAN